MSPTDYDDYMYAIEVLRGGNEAQLNELKQLVHDFPHGVDGFVGRRWIMNAIDCGSMISIKWILAHDVDLSFRDEGYTVLHAALERSGETDCDEVLKLLLNHGAPINAHGFNDWTPAHMAAARENIDALKLLILFGADLTIRTRIDGYATPLEEAKALGKHLVVEFLENIK